MFVSTEVENKNQPSEIFPLLIRRRADLAMTFANSHRHWTLIAENLVLSYQKNHGSNIIMLLEEWWKSQKAMDPP